MRYMRRVSVEPFYRDLGQRIEHARRKLGLTQEQLGDLVQPPLKRVTISNIETGKQRVLVHTLVSVVDALGIELTTLLPARKALPSKSDKGLQHKLAKELSSADQARAILKTIESTEAKHK